jgi:hypothetical protein
MFGISELLLELRRFVDAGSVRDDEGQFVCEA